MVKMSILVNVILRLKYRKLIDKKNESKGSQIRWTLLSVIMNYVVVKGLILACVKLRLQCRR
jgi:hypothetical protein